MSHKDLKREVIIGFIILAISLFFQIIGYYYSRNNDKKDIKISRQIELTEQFSENIYQHIYLCSFSLTQAFLKFELAESYSHNLDSPAIIEISRKDRMNLDDSLRIKYPIVYNKSLDYDLKSTELLSNLMLIELHFPNAKIKVYSELIKQKIQPQNELHKYLENRLETDSSRVLDHELDEFYLNHLGEITGLSDTLINLMVNEYSK